MATPKQAASPALANFAGTARFWRVFGTELMRERVSKLSNSIVNFSIYHTVLP